MKKIGYKIFLIILILCFNICIVKNVSSQEANSNTDKKDEKIISLDVKNMNLEDALRLMADQSGLNMVTSKNVKGTITVKLKNVSVKDALNAILEVNNCKYVEEDNIIKVYTYQDLQQEERFINLETKIYSLKYARLSSLKPILDAVKSPRGKIELRPQGNQIIVIDIPDVIKQIDKMIAELDKEAELRVYELNYANPDEIKTKLAQIISKTEGEVIVDTRTSSIIVKAYPAIQKEAELMIRRWDKQNRQVQIEAKIIEVTLDDSLKLGIDWQYQKTNAAKEPTLKDFSTILGQSLTKGGIYKVGALSADDYAATLEMLATRTNTDVLSSPRITVLNGEEAKILVGSSEPYLITSEDPVTGFVTQSTKFIDVGIKLIVTPKIGEDNHITMKIHPEVSTWRWATKVDAIAVDTSEADTTLTVKNGETVVLGGLMKQKKTKIVKKVPILGDIPILGLFFRSKDESTEKKELIVFITPHVLDAEGKIVLNKEEQRIEEFIRGTIRKIKERRQKKEEGEFEFEQD